MDCRRCLTLFLLLSISRQAVANGDCAHVIGGSARQTSSDNEFWTISATVSSNETGWDKYADEWQVRTVSGTVLGTRVLAHPHVTEQPFTRSLSGVQVPETVATIVLHARDSVLGYCGDSYSLTIRSLSSPDSNATNLPAASPSASPSSPSSGATDTGSPSSDALPFSNANYTYMSLLVGGMVSLAWIL